MQRTTPFLCVVLLLLAAGPSAQAQAIRVLISDPAPSGHGRQVESAFENTADGYGLDTDVSVRAFNSPAELVSTAIEEGYDLVYRARQPSNPAIVSAAETAWENGIAFVSPHGSNSPVRYEVTPAILENGPIFIGGEDLEAGLDGTYGANLEVDALTSDGSALMSYAPAAGAAILCWVYREGTDASLTPAERWKTARALLHLLGGRYDDLPTPEDLDESENELSGNVSTFASWTSYAGANVTRTERPDGTIRIESSGGNHPLKFYDGVETSFPAGSGFTEMNVTNQGGEPLQLSTAIYNRTTVAAGETKKVIIRHGFQATQRRRIFYRMWANDAEASIDAVFEPVVFVTQQPALSPVYDAPYADEYGYGLVMATRAGLLGTGQLGAAEQVYAQQQQDRLEAAIAELPVELAGFAAQVEGRDAVLTWRTFSEENSAGFQIEHRRGDASGDGNDDTWAPAGPFVEGAGTSQETQTYTRRISDLDVGAHVFRLRQVDTDNTERVIARARVEVQLQEAYELEGAYPNPFRHRATVEFVVRRGQRVTAALYDALGQRVRMLHEGEVAGGETIALPVEARGLASGVYFVHLRGEDFTATEEVTITR